MARLREELADFGQKTRDGILLIVAFGLASLASFVISGFLVVPILLAIGYIGIDSRPYEDALWIVGMAIFPFALGVFVPEAVDHIRKERGQGSADQGA